MAWRREAPAAAEGVAERSQAVIKPSAGCDVPSSAAPPPGCPFQPRCQHPPKDEECRWVLPPLQDSGGGQLVACLKVPVGSGAGNGWGGRAVVTGRSEAVD